MLLLLNPLVSALGFTAPVRITTNIGKSWNPSVAAYGSFVYVAWQDNTPVPGSHYSYEVWLRASSNYGASFGSPVRITNNTGFSGYPSVAASGTYVYVAWDDSTYVPGSGDGPEVWMRISSNNGASFGSPVRISTNTGSSVEPSVAAVGSYVYVAWIDDTPVAGSGSACEIWLRVSSNNGASFGSAIRITTNTGGSYNPSVAAVGNYVYVAWDDETPVSGSGSTFASEIWMRVSSNNGASFGSALRITTNTGDSQYPSDAAAGDHVYVAWYDDTPVTGSGTAPEIWMRASANNGASFGSAVRITTNTGNSTFPSVAASGSYVYVAWMDDTHVAGGLREIWLRFSSNNGAGFWSPIRLTTNTGYSLYPSAAVGSKVYVAWQDSTPVTGSGLDYEIWLRAGS
jgi:hypothetical protein